MSSTVPEISGTSTSSKRILVICPDLRPSGGGNVVAVCIVEALKRDNTVSLLTWRSVNVIAINRIFGTALNESEFTVLLPPIFLRFIENLHPILSSLRYGILLRLAKKMKNNYDLIISVNNESDFGCRGILYFHDPPYWLCPTNERPRPNLNPVAPHELWAVLKDRRRPWMFVGGFSYERMKTNVTLVNSNWTGTKLKEIYALESTTVYPPVVGHFPDVPWKERENGFVCIGRITSSKEFEKVGQIITEVRTMVPDAHLHIVGTSAVPVERDYRKRLLGLTEKCPWIAVNEDISRYELIRLISTHRYGIHGMVNEPFGLAVAEMVQGGCIVFVPQLGGPSEIVGADDRLLYDTVEEAVRKIVTVMSSHEQQVSLRRFLSSRRDLFTQELFTRRIREIVREFPKRSVSMNPPESLGLRLNPLLRD